ncbi:membrane-anchored ubiquitin-fold protein 3 isoform X2 [Solanum lycopersicum]|uniref:membrane-anchored ubiquitin-fold protein 3 isoform X2 n=1 Tax=Solanum lycopersicum TaxID=4081 RepID=UPI000E1E20A0|nr:membrane-anchored ubiquitin-fold protein 3 isoform X2 [Solanum lycopersicum]
MALKELIEIKFRLADGSDIGPNKYTPATTVGSLKEKIIAQWPKDSGPKTINDVKLINAGMILENNRTLGESRLPVAEVAGGVITMHVVVRPPMNEKARVHDNHRTAFRQKSLVARIGYFCITKCQSVELMRLPSPVFNFLDVCCCRFLLIQKYKLFGPLVLLVLYAYFACVKTHHHLVNLL